MKRLSTLLLVLLVFAFSPVLSYAQSQMQTHSNYFDNTMISNEIMKQLNSHNNTVGLNELGEFDGSPFIYENSKPAIIVMKNDELHRVNHFNIDAFNDNFAVSDNNDFNSGYVAIEKTNIKEVKVITEPRTKYTVTYLNITSTFKNKSLGICEQLYRDEENNFIILKKYSSEFKPAVKSNNSFSSDKAAMFKMDKQIFVKKSDGSIELIKKEKDFIKLFGDRSKEVKKYIKSNKLDYTNGRHLKLMFLQLNDLVI